MNQKQILLVIAACCFSSAYAESCPSPKDIKSGPNNFLVTSSGWRSDRSYEIADPGVLVFEYASYSRAPDNKENFGGCQYQGGGNVVKMLPPADVRFVATNNNWAAYPASPGLYLCEAVGSQGACEFTLSRQTKATINPFD